MNFPASPAQGSPSRADVVAYVGLSTLPRVGPRTVRRWIAQAGSPAAAWARLPALAGARSDADLLVAAWRAAEPAALVARAEARGITVLVWDHGAYPPALRSLSDPPPALFVRGRLEHGPAVAIVGSRRATSYGRAVAERLAADLAAAGVTVVSGLARGIDAAAHRGALDGGGCTVAVLGCGVDVVYPREHGALADAIAVRGALVSEFAPGSPPLPGHFPRRNRLISGLALGVVVVEGTDDSGALLTVDYALEQGREVFAVPGSVFSAQSRAPHRLLREGARIVEMAEDVLAELQLGGGTGAATAAQMGDAQTAGAPGSGPAVGRDERAVLDLLDRGPRTLDELVEDGPLPAGRVAAALSLLEIRGLVRRMPGQMVMRVSRLPALADRTRPPHDGGAS